MMHMMVLLASFVLALAAVATPASAASGKLTLTFRDSQGHVLARVHPSTFQFEGGDPIPIFGSTGHGKLIVQLSARDLNKFGLSPMATMDGARLRIAETPLSVIRLELRGAFVTDLEFLFGHSATPQAKLTIAYTSLSRL
jgi:hypothetical protein